MVLAVPPSASQSKAANSSSLSALLCSALPHFPLHLSAWSIEGIAAWYIYPHVLVKQVATLYIYPHVALRILSLGWHVSLPLSPGNRPLPTHSLSRSF